MEIAFDAERKRELEKEVSEKTEVESGLEGQTDHLPNDSDSFRKINKPAGADRNEKNSKKFCL